MFPSQEGSWRAFRRFPSALSATVGCFAYSPDALHKIFRDSNSPSCRTNSRSNRTSSQESDTVSTFPRDCGKGTDYLTAAQIVSGVLREKEQISRVGFRWRSDLIFCSPADLSLVLAHCSPDLLIMTCTKLDIDTILRGAIHEIAKTKIICTLGPKSRDVPILE